MLLEAFYLRCLEGLSFDGFDLATPEKDPRRTPVSHITRHEVTDWFSAVADGDGRRAQHSLAISAVHVAVQGIHGPSAWAIGRTRLVFAIRHGGKIFDAPLSHLWDRQGTAKNFAVPATIHAGQGFGLLLYAPEAGGPTPTLPAFELTVSLFGRRMEE
jgi:hypothetical protein